MSKEWTHPLHRNSFALPFLNFILMSWLATKWSGADSADLARVFFWLGTAPLAVMTLYMIARQAEPVVSEGALRSDGQAASQSVGCQAGTNTCKRFAVPAPGLLTRFPTPSAKGQTSFCTIEAFESFLTTIVSPVNLLAAVGSLFPRTRNS